jgi:hypothetical protein
LLWAAPRKLRECGWNRSSHRDNYAVYLEQVAVDYGARSIHAHERSGANQARTQAANRGTLVWECQGFR